MCHVEECKFQLGSFQYRGDQLRFVLANLLQDEDRRNVLLEHLTLTQLQVNIKTAIKFCENLDIDVHYSLENSSRYVGVENVCCC